MNSVNTTLTREAIDYVFTNKPEKFKYVGTAALICEMRLGGMTYKEIGQEVGLSSSRVREYIVRVCRYYRRYRCQVESKQVPKKTLFDEIKEMSVTDLADFLTDVEPIPHRVDRYICRKCKKEHGGKCPCNDGDCLYGSYTESDLTREWLLQEVEE